MIAWSLVHGGWAGNFFSKTLYNAIAFDRNTRVSYLEDVSDGQLREKIAAVGLVSQGNNTYSCYKTSTDRHVVIQ